MSAVHILISIPHYWKKRVKQDLNRDVTSGITEPVPMGTPTSWCSRMAGCTRKGLFPRHTVDLLNAAAMREFHPTLSPFNQVSIVLAQKRKTLLDAWNRYNSLPLSLAAQDATTFITEWGWCRYLETDIPVNSMILQWTWFEKPVA